MFASLERENWIHCKSLFFKKQTKNIKKQILQVLIHDYSKKNSILDSIFPFPILPYASSPFSLRVSTGWHNSACLTTQEDSHHHQTPRVFTPHLIIRRLAGENLIVGGSLPFNHLPCLMQFQETYKGAAQIKLESDQKKVKKKKKSNWACKSSFSQTICPHVLESKSWLYTCKTCQFRNILSHISLLSV